MLSSTIIPTFLAVVFSSISVQATPIASTSDLALRNNDYDLFCSNAPSFLAGHLIPQSAAEIVPVLPESGSNQKWLKYLWCTIATKTYSFFDFATIDPPLTEYYNIEQAFKVAQAEVSDHIANYGDGNLVLGLWTIDPANTNVHLQVNDAKGKMTWGILGAALSGLSLASLNYGAGRPMVFQINDGDHGEVGIGMVGVVVDGTCYYEIDSSGKKLCDDMYKGKVIN